MRGEAEEMTERVRTIRLYGKLGAKFGRVHRLAVNSAAEAIRALGSQLRGFEAFLTQSKDMGFGYAVFYGKRNIGEDELRNLTENDEIRFAPIVFGAKNGGVFQIIIGAVLIVAGALLSWTPIGPLLVKVGISLVIGGIIQLLTPVPKGSAAKDSPNNQASFAFNGPINTQAQGNPVQVLYGESIVGSAVLSAGINAVDQAYAPARGWGGGGFRWHDEWIPTP